MSMLCYNEKIQVGLFCLTDLVRDCLLLHFSMYLD